MKLFSVRLFNTEIASIDDRGQWRFAESTSPSGNWNAGIHRTVFPMTVEDMIQASSAKRLTPDELAAAANSIAAVAQVGDVRHVLHPMLDVVESWFCAERGLPGRWEMFERTSRKSIVEAIGNTCECGASKCGSLMHSTWCPASKS